MADDLDQRLETALQTRTDLQAKKQRLEGRLEAAQKALTDVEAECRAKGVDPNKLDETIQKLTERYTEAVTSLETEIQEASTALSPYLKETVT